MLLAFDMGNTHTEIGVLDGKNIVMTERVATDLGKTDTEYGVLLHTILEIRGISPSAIEGAIISSVVPPLTGVLKRAVRMVTGRTALVVGPGVKNGLKLKIDNPRALGADLVVDAVGAIALYGAPVIIIDMGTATTVCYVDEEKAFRGGLIIPGVNISLNALSSETSQLPRISLEDPGKIVGTNTIASMKSGIVYGQASMLDGLIDRIREEMQSDAAVVATGGLAGVITPFCRHEITRDSELMLRGLQIIYAKNVS